MENEILFEIAKRVDNEYQSKREDYLVKRGVGFYQVYTDKCDMCSFIRVYFDLSTKITRKVTVCGYWTNGFEEVSQWTYMQINDILTSKGLTPITIH